MGTVSCQLKNANCKTFCGQTKSLNINTFILISKTQKAYLWSCESCVV